MDWLYRIYYTVLSLGILMILLFPVAVALRFMLRNIEKRYTVWIWRILFLRSICPVALSSALCMFPSINRGYHRFLGDLGLAIRDGKGIMRSWMSVFTHSISASWAFRVCSMIWVLGALGVLLFTFVCSRRLRKELQAARVIGENIYESPVLLEPVKIGVFRERLYLPQGFQAKETAWLLRHMEQHHFDGIRRNVLLLILACHWFNPVMWLYYYWWGMDVEMAADDRTVYREKESERRAYAQAILNFTQEQKGKGKIRVSSLFFMGVTEKNTEKRAYRMMYRKRDKVNDKLFGVLIISLLAVFCFLLRPMQIAWSGGTWGNGAKQKEEESLIHKKSGEVVAKMGTKSPEGLDRIIQLEMVKGTKNQQGYDGTFVIKMYDTLENEIASREVADIFPEIEKGGQHFSENVTLCISDYNGDNVQELVIGQQASAVPLAESASSFPAQTAGTEEETEPETRAYTYGLVSIQNEKLEVLCRDIAADGETTTMGESIPFGKLDGIDDIFTVVSGGETIYYIWNGRENTYEKRAMTEQDIEYYRENAQIRAGSEETKEHTLEDSSGTTAVMVSTKQDSTGSEEIKSVILFPRGDSKKFQDIQGYYCDLIWAPAQEEQNRYAQLIYNGTKSQTFVLYDTKRKTVYYQHDDGTEKLAAAFAQVGEDGITFNEGGAIIYELTGKNKDVLSIKFAVDADNGVTLKGSYQYDVVKRKTSNLSFSRVAG